MVNLLTAVDRFSNLDSYSLERIYSSDNRINRVGDQLEYFTQDLFCGSFQMDKDEKLKKYSEYFSWLGTKNHPPDFIIEGSDAFEVKKTTSKAGSIQLNSSIPHQKLRSDNKRITKECRACEDGRGGWEEKDFGYVLGRVTRGSGELDFLWIVYGDCWAAEEQVYKNLSENISTKLNEAVETLEYGELSQDTNELGKVRKADPMGRTKLRMRGMWIMDHPAKYFKKHVENYSEKINDSTPLFAVMRKEKFESYPQEDRNRVLENHDVKLREIDVPNPSNPAERVEAVFLEVLPDHV